MAITVDPVAATLTLAADRQVVLQGHQVVFQTNRSPSSAGPYGVPYRVTAWQFTTDGGTQVPTGCTTGKSCAFSPTSSGTMAVSAVVNGAAQTATVHIRVACALTGDSLLDSLPLLDLMHRADSASGNPNVAGNQASRREYYFALRNVGGGWVDTLVNLGTPCRGTPPNPQGLSGLVADGHDHPFHPYVPRNTPPAFVFQNQATDELPVICDSTPGPHGMVAGPSSGDISNIETRNSVPNPVTVPHYLFDADSIYRIPGGGFPQGALDRAGNVRSFPRRQNNCQIL